MCCRTFLHRLGSSPLSSSLTRGKGSFGEKETSYPLKVILADFARKKGKVFIPLKGYSMLIVYEVKNDIS